MALAARGSTVVYEEPDTYGRPITVRITRKEAIRRQKDAALYWGHEYPDDNLALEDFLAIHWGWEE